MAPNSSESTQSSLRSSDRQGLCRILFTNQMEELRCVYKLCTFDQLGKEQEINMESVFQGAQSRKAAHSMMELMSYNSDDLASLPSHYLSWEQWL